METWLIISAAIMSLDIMSVGIKQLAVHKKRVKSFARVPSEGWVNLRGVFGVFLALNSIRCVMFSISFASMRHRLSAKRAKLK